MNALREKIEKNCFFNNITRSIVMASYNNRLEKIISEFTKVDSIQDIDQFKEKIRVLKIPKSNNIYAIKKSYSEGLLYGHINALYKYAGLDKREFIYSPTIEHGIQFYGNLRNNYFPRIFQGEYLFQQWHMQKPGVPLFAVGPYIHYAENYYSEKKVESIKHKNGKTLLVFPFHSYEFAKIKYGESNFVKKIMHDIAREYSTVIVCAYWLDINSNLYKMFEAEGATLVSAGFRSDPNFISRLKTIINLADSVYSNAIGTFVGYALYLNKPVYLELDQIQQESEDLTITDKMEVRMQRCNYEFGKLFSPKYDKSLKEQLEFCNLYWGFDCIKSPDELKQILVLNKKLLIKSRGFDYKIPNSCDILLKSKLLNNEEIKILDKARR